MRVTLLDVLVADQHPQAARAPQQQQARNNDSKRMTKNALVLKPQSPLSGIAAFAVARASNQLEAAVATMLSGAVLISSAAVASNGDPLIASSSLAVHNGEKHASVVIITTDEEHSDAKALASAASLAMGALDESEEFCSNGSAAQDISGATDTTGGAASVLRKAGAPRQPSFVVRMVHELSRKRALNVQISQTQLEMKRMQLLMSGYQADVQRVLTQLNSEALALEDACAGIKQSMTVVLTRLSMEGWCRALVDTYRSLQLVLLQENKLQRAHVALRRGMLQTRDEECDWMGGAIADGYQRQVRWLVSQLSGAGGESNRGEEPPLDDDDPIVHHALSADDPFFANPEHLHKASAQSKQLELQLRSVAALIVTMRARVQELITAQSEKSSELEWLLPAPAATTTVLPSILKGSSLKERAISRRSSSVRDANSVTTAKQKQLRRILGEVAKLIDLPAGSGDGGASYSACLNEFARLVSDQRTRVGRLSSAFAKKLEEDTRVAVEVLATATSTQSAPQRSSGESWSMEAIGDADEDIEADAERDTDNLFISDLRFLETAAGSHCRTSERDDQVEDKEPGSQNMSTAAVDVSRLPPPIWILAFARFLQKLIASEYALDEPSSDKQGEVDEEMEKARLSFGSAVGASHLLDHLISERTLKVCVHHFVFSKLSTFCCAYEQSRFCEDVDPTAHAFLQQQHWQHSKQAIQRVLWEQLAFPSDVAEIIRRHLDTPMSGHQQSAFLPQTLHAFKSVECETTPNGVVHAVMNAFTVLHRELGQLLRDDTNSKTPPSAVSTVLNADVLIPSLVLMMSRLNHESELDLLWRRLNLVRVFHATLLGQGSEEAYYVTCLQAAMHVIQTFAVTDASAVATHHISLIDTRAQCENCQKLIAHRRRYRTTIKRPCNNNSNNEGDHSASLSSFSGRAELRRSMTRKKSTSTHDNEVEANLTDASCPQYQLSDDAAAIENLSNWITNQASVDHRMSIPDNIVPAHELWLYQVTESGF